MMNAVSWALGEEGGIPAEGATSELVGDFNPTRYNLDPSEYWVERNMKPADYR